VETDDVNAAFEMLLEQMAELLKHVKLRGAEALRQGALERAREALEILASLQKLVEELERLRRRCQALLPERPEPPVPEPGPGVRTPERAFRRPILEALKELGGRGSVDDVLRRVEAKVSGKLTEFDRKPLPTGGIRWRNTAMWCRKHLVIEGLLSSDSPRGIWELSPKGWDELRRLASLG